MKKFEVYSFDEQEIIDAYKKEGINVDYIENKDEYLSVQATIEDRRKLSKLEVNCYGVSNGSEVYVVLKHILKIPYNRRVYMKSKFFCPDERQNFFGEFYLILVE